MINLNYQYKLKLNKSQRAKIDFFLESCRKIYNYALKEKKDWINSRKSSLNCCSLRQEYILPADEPFPNYNLQAKRLTAYRKTNQQLKLVHSQVLQQTLKVLDKAFVDMRAKNFGFPRFKKTNRSFLFPQLSKNPLDNGEIKLPSFGWLKIRQSRPYPEGFIAKTARILKRPSGYYVIITFQLDLEIPEPIVGKTSLGIDAGISSFLTTSSNKIVKPPRFLLQVQRKLRLLQRRLKKKVKGSRNWQKLQGKIAKVHEKVANTRLDWHWKLAHSLCDQAENIFIEDINYQSWSKGLFSKQSHDHGIGKFFNQILPYVAFKRGRYFLKVNKDFTSQECPQCNKRTGKKKLSVRVHDCQFCGCQMDRDIAAAKIIKQRGELAVGTLAQRKCLWRRSNGG